MSTPQNKRHPEIIYIRRRIAAVVILVVVAGLLIWLMSVVGGGNKTNAEDPSAVATTASSTAAPSSTSSASASSTDSDSSASSSASHSLAAPSDARSTEPTTSAKRGTKNTCELKDLVISARSDQDSFDAGQQPRFYMTVDNPTNVDCEIDLAENPLRFEVYDLATNKRIWSDMDCTPTDEQDSRVFPAGEQRYYEVIWSRTSSAPNSCNKRENVPEGGYYLYTLVGANHSDPITFNLHGNA